MVQKVCCWEEWLDELSQIQLTHYITFDILDFTRRIISIACISNFWLIVQSLNLILHFRRRSVAAGIIKTAKIACRRWVVGPAACPVCPIWRLTPTAKKITQIHFHAPVSVWKNRYTAEGKNFKKQQNVGPTTVPESWVYFYFFMLLEFLNNVKLILRF